MTLFVRGLQIALALWTITGAVYMMGHYEVLASSFAYRALPPAFWVSLGIAEIVLAIGLLISIKDGKLQKYATPSAIGLALITLAGIVLYGAYAGLGGMLWAILPAGLLAFVAYKRRVKSVTTL